MLRNFKITGLTLAIVAMISGYSYKLVNADEKGLAAHLYFKIPIGAGKTPSDSARFGFRLEQQMQGDGFELDSNFDDINLGLNLPLFNVELTAQGLVQTKVFGIDGDEALKFILPEAFNKSAASPTEINSLASRLITGSTSLDIDTDDAGPGPNMGATPLHKTVPGK